MARRASLHHLQTPQEWQAAIQLLPDMIAALEAMQRPLGTRDARKLALEVLTKLQALKTGHSQQGAFQDQLADDLAGLPDPFGAFR